jgi:hypothetical protein
MQVRNVPERHGNDGEMNMRPYVRNFAIWAAAVGMLGAIGHSQSDCGEEAQKRDRRRPTPEEKAAHERAARDGVSEKEIEQVKKEFEPAANSTPKEGSAAKTANQGAVGIVTPKPSIRDTHGKAILQDSPAANSARKTHNLPDASSMSADRPETESTTQQEARKPPSAGQEADSKNEVGHEHSTHHGTTSMRISPQTLEPTRARLKGWGPARSVKPWASGTWVHGPTEIDEVAVKH